MTDEDLSAIKRRSRSSSRDRGIGRTKSMNEKDKTTENSRRGRKKPEGLGSSVHSSRSSMLETSKTNSVRGNNTLEMLLSLPKDEDGTGGGGQSVAESRGARTAPARTRSKKKSKDDDDGNMSVMSFDNVEEWGSGAKSKKKSSRSKKPASKLILEE